MTMMMKLMLNTFLTRYLARYCTTCLFAADLDEQTILGVRLLFSTQQNFHNRCHIRCRYLQEMPTDCLALHTFTMHSLNCSTSERRDVCKVMKQDFDETGIIICRSAGLAHAGADSADSSYYLAPPSLIFGRPCHHMHGVRKQAMHVGQLWCTIL